MIIESSSLFILILIPILNLTGGSSANHPHQPTPKALPTQPKFSGASEEFLFHVVVRIVGAILLSQCPVG